MCTNGSIDYIGQNTPTVTITLREYRELISAKATAANKTNEIETENNLLRGENERLKQRILRLTKDTDAVEVEQWA